MSIFKCVKASNHAIFQTIDHLLKGEVGPTGQAGNDGQRGDKGEPGKCPLICFYQLYILYLHLQFISLSMFIFFFQYVFN